MRFCERCGARNEDDARFCISCGKPVDADVPIGQPAEQPAPAPVPDTYETSELPPWQGVSAQAPAPAPAAAASAPELEPTPAPATGEADGALAGIDERLAAMEDSLAKLTAQFEDKISRNEHEATVLKQVSAEVEEYRNGLYEKLTMPFIRDIIEVRSGIESMLARHAGEESVPADEVRVFGDMLADVLEKHSVEAVASEPGDEFLSFKHKTVGQVPTTDESLHGRIAEVEGESYRLGDQYIAPALVKVYTVEK